MNRRSLLIILLVTIVIGSLLYLLATDDSSETEAFTFTVMSYNIHHGRGMDDRVDLERIAQVILDEGADIVALQEVDVGMERTDGVDIARELAELTGMEHVVFGSNLEIQGGEYGTATLSRFPIVEHENSHFEQLGPEQRGVLQTMIDVDGRSLLMINTHLDYRGDDNSERMLYIRETRDRILPAWDSEAIIYAGDFNDVPGSDVHRELKGYMSDVWESVGSGDGFTIPVNTPNRRIDWIFYDDGVEPLRAWVPVTQASDHLPVVAEFRFR